MLTTDNAVSELLTFRDMVRWGASQFNAAHLYFGHGTTNAWDEALLLVRHSLHLSPNEDKYVADARLLSVERQKIADLFQRRINERIPAPYLTHQAWFAELAFYVDERVIIPRSPIAELIEQGFSPWLNTEPSHILDLCTGSGCIAIACALGFPEAHIDAVDISTDALAVAQRNVQHHHVNHRVRLTQADLLNKLPPQEYQVIVCNPPYVDASDMQDLPTEYRHEPSLALAGGEDGLDLVARVLKDAPAYLAPAGILIVEVGNSALAAETRFAHYPMTWLEFERGGQGVFVLTKEQLVAGQSDLIGE